VRRLRQEGHDVTAHWYNPNIHPAQEYRARLAAFREYLVREWVPAVIDDQYGLGQFLSLVWPGEAQRPERCHACYRSRLGATARAAARGGFDAFTSTLLGSPYQPHRAVTQIGEAAGAREGVIFLDLDWRPGFRAGQRAADEMGLYRQGYCGCVFSEAERLAAEGLNWSGLGSDNPDEPQRPLPGEARRPGQQPEGPI
jgi:predicted adenine nucleotide alpha hydrolase (AANH) superfamily ATPase